MSINPAASLIDGWMDEANVTASAQNIFICSYPDDMFVFVSIPTI